jgi:hypothetical protein
MRGSYKGLIIELLIDFVIMYLVMYTMIASLDHLLVNLNNFYMTLMMVAPMTVVMLVAMRSMFPARRQLGYRDSRNTHIYSQLRCHAYPGSDRRCAIFALDDSTSLWRDSHV